MIPKDPPHITIPLEERQRIEAKAKQRMASKEVFRKALANPHLYSNPTFFDLAIQRVEANASGASQLKFFKPNLRNFRPLLFFLIIPTATLFFAIRGQREAFEARCRNGEIAYRDRNWKFI